MQRAKAFFFVCAGVFLLGLGYHLGARSADAQLGGTIQAAECLYNNGSETITAVGRTVRRVSSNSSRPAITFAPVPGTDPIIAVGVGGGGEYLALLANGDTYAAEDFSGAPWHMLYNALGSPTAEVGTSWGQVKARYR